MGLEGRILLLPFPAESSGGLLLYAGVIDEIQEPNSSERLHADVKLDLIITIIFQPA